MNATKESIEQTAAELGLTMEADFVPLSKSRNAKEKSPTLNWKVRLLKNGKAFLETDYSAGCGHAPSYQQHNSNACRAQAVDAECERGYAHKIDGMAPRKTKTPILPSFADVLHSLVSDADVIDCGSFEEWAGNLGYDADSRKAEGIYRACLETALKLRNALGDAGFATLRTAVQDY